MKLLRTVKIVPTVTAILSAALLTVAIGGCGEVTDTTGSTSTTSFKVTPGDYMGRKVSGDGKISLTITGVDMDDQRDSQPLIYFYDGKGYGGGRTTGGFQGDLRNYKLKYYGSHGEIESESYHGTKFRSTETYNVVLEWKTGNDGFMRSTINGSVFEKPGAVADSFTVGIGYPPSVRPGWDGAVYTNIVWPKGENEVR